MSLSFDPDRALTVLRRDPPLAILIERIGAFDLELRGPLTPFQSLLQAIVYQQLSGKAAGAIHGRLLALYEGQGLSPATVLKTEEQQLRGVGLSRAKVAAVRDLATKTLEGVVPALDQLETMEDLEIISRLTAVRGVGRWTVEMMLLFQMGRPDVLPVTDLGVRKGFMLTYGLSELPVPAELLERGERWRPYRSVASWYLWRAVDQAPPP